MHKYIAFLRGINVGNIRIKMPDLKAAFEKFGFQEVKTYLQTGNVVFVADQPIESIKTILEKGLSETFHYKAYVLLYEYAELAAIIAGYPFPRDEHHHAYIVFVDKKAVLEELQGLSRNLGEELQNLVFGEKVIYWKVVVSQSTDAPFSKTMAKAKYKSSLTVRNLNTLEKMV